MAYLLDTNAISEVFRPRPNPNFVAWLNRLPREEQFTSTVVIAELYVAAFRADSAEKWLSRIEDSVLPAVTVLPFDLACAREAGEIQARLSREGSPIGTADVQIAATARIHSLTVATANQRHFRHVPGLTLRTFSPGER